MDGRRQRGVITGARSAYPYLYDFAAGEISGGNRQQQAKQKVTAAFAGFVQQNEHKQKKVKRSPKPAFAAPGQHRIEQTIAQTVVDPLKKRTVSAIQTFHIQNVETK